MKRTEIFEIVKTIIKKWLEKHGMGNGYCSYVRGNIEVGRCQSISLFTVLPNDSNLTGNQISERNRLLEKEIITALPEDRKTVEDTEIDVQCVHVEHGVYRTNISLNVSEFVWPW